MPTRRLWLYVGHDCKAGNKRHKPMSWEIFIDAVCGSEHSTCIEAQVFLPVVRIKRPHHLDIMLGNAQKHIELSFTLQAKMEPAAAGQKEYVSGRVSGVVRDHVRKTHHLSEFSRHEASAPNRSGGPTDAARIEIGRDGYLRRNISQTPGGATANRTIFIHNAFINENL